MENKLDLTGGGGSPSSVQDTGGGALDGFNPGLLIYILNKSILWIILSVVICVFAAFIYLRYTPRIFESTTRLILKAEQSTNILGIENLVFEKDLSEVNREMQVLKSPVMLSAICDSLKLGIGYFKEGKSKFISEDIYRSSPYKVEGEIIDFRISNIPIYIKLINTRKYLISYSLNGQDFEQENTYGNTVTTEHFSAKISLATQQLSEAEINSIYFFKFYEKNYITSLVSSKLIIVPIDASNKTLEISFRDQNPEKAKDLLKILSREFIAFDVKKKRESIENIVKFIDLQMDSFGRVQESIQDSMSRFKISNEIYGDEASYSGLLTRMNELQNEILKYESQLLSIKTFKNIIQTTKDYNTLPYIKLTESELNIESDIDKINRYQAQREARMLDVTEDHPEIRMLDRQVDAAKLQLVKRTENASANLSIQLEKLKVEYQKVLSKVYTLPELQEQLRRLSRLAEARNKFYYNLFDQRSAYAIASAGIVPDYIILAEANLPHSPVSPVEDQIKIGSIILGLLIGLIIVAVRFLLHKTIVSVNEISSKTQAPMLGVIPSYNTPMERSQVVVTKNPKSTITEAFRAIRSNLQFISNGDGCKVLSSTSTIPGEGKTFMAINLAAIISMLDKKVVILDCDMRKPRLGKIFGIDASKGMSTILSKQSGIDESILPTGIKNIDVIIAGPIPPNPSELILNDIMDETIEYLKTKYDYIVIDTPPIGLVTDALTILKKADYPIYVLRAAYSDRAFIQNVNKLYIDNDIKKLGIILNDYGRGPSGYSYNYGYGYGYSYGYGYGVYGSYGFKTGYYSEDTSITQSKKESLLSRIFKVLKP